MTTNKISYPATEQAIAWTPESLADGSYDFSASIANGADLDLDKLVGGWVKTGTSPVAGGTIEIYAALKVGGVWSAGVPGTDGGTPDTGEENQLYLVDVIVVDGTSDHQYEIKPFSIAELLAGLMATDFCIGCKNDSGAALNATDAASFAYDRIQSTSA